MSFHSEEIDDDDIYVEQIQPPETVNEEECRYNECMEARVCDDPRR
jgi:hypothetical protein